LDFVATKQLDFVATKQLDFVATKQLDFLRADFAGREPDATKQLDWTEICEVCDAGDICAGGVMLHCPNHSTTPFAGNDESANCVCNTGFASP